MYYAYWSDLPVGGLRHHDPGRGPPGLGGASRPTTTSPSCPSAGRSRSSTPTAGTSRANFFATVELAPEFAERVRAAKRESKFIGSAELPGYFRKPFGPGWALVGDAGYHKNPITAMGINDAFRDAELLAGALDDVVLGRRSYEEAMATTSETRDREALPVYEFTDEFAQLQPAAARDAAAASGRCAATRRRWTAFVSVQAATLPAPEFFAPENVGKIMERGGFGQLEKVST